MGRDDFDIPDFGPAEPDRVSHHAATRNGGSIDAQPLVAQPERRGGGGWFQSFLLILLVAGCSGLGYWTLTLTEQLKSEQKSVAELQGQMAEMRSLLNMAESSAEKSGSTMLDKIADVNRAAQGKYKYFDSEIAKLWTIAYQRNKPELEKQAKTLASQGKQLDKTTKSVLAQDKKLKSLDAKLGKNQKALKAELSSDLKKMRADVAATQTSVRLTEELVQEEQAELSASLRGLTDRTAALENTQRKNALERRIKINEEAIDAFDATRRELNRSLLQIRKRINELQLSVEKQGSQAKPT